VAETKYPKVRVDRLVNFLEAFANLPGEQIAFDAADKSENPHILAFVREYGEFFPASEPVWDQRWAELQKLKDWSGTARADEPLSTAELRIHTLNGIVIFRDELRRLWKVRNLLERDWLMHELRRKASSLFRPGRKADEPPPHDPLEQACIEFMRRRLKVRTCQNEDCNHPFFIADAPNSRYCSTKCFEETRKQKKDAWWDTDKARSILQARKDQRRKNRRTRGTRQAR